MAVLDKYLNQNKKDKDNEQEDKAPATVLSRYLSGGGEADNSASYTPPPFEKPVMTTRDERAQNTEYIRATKQQQKAQKEYDNAVKEMNQAWQSLMGHTYTTNEIADNATMFQQKALGERKNNYETGLNRYNNLQAEVERNAQERKNLDPDFEYVASQMEKSLNQQLADGKISQDYYDEMMRGVQYTRETQAANNLYDDREEKLKLLDAKYDYLKYSPDFVKNSSGDNQAEKIANETKDFAYEKNGINPLGLPTPTYRDYDKDTVAKMNQDEIATYNYIYNTQGRDAADEYYDYLKETQLHPRVRQEYTDKVTKYAYKHPILASLSSIVAQPLNIVSGIGQAAQVIAEGKMDANAPYNAMVWKNAGERQGAGQRVYDEAGGGDRGNWAQWGYGTAMSVLDNVYRMLLTGGYGSKVPQEVVEALDLALMASSFAPQAIVEAKDNGMDDLQAVFVGLLESGVEILTEKVSVESFLKGNWDKKKWMSFLKQIIAEGSEEGAADILDLGIEMILAGDKTELQRTYDDYIAGGMSHYEAEKNAWREWTSQLWMDILGGAVSGGVMGGSGILKASFKNKFVTAKAVTDEFNKEIGSKVKDAEGVAKAKFTAIRNVGMIDTILKENKNELSDLERGHLEAVKKGYQEVIDTTLSGSTNEVIAKAESLSGNRTQENVLNSQLTDLVRKGTSEAQEKMFPKAGETISLDTAETANESWNTETSNLMARHGIESEVLTLDDYDNPTLTAAQQEIKGKVSKEALETARAWRDLGWGKIGFYNDEGWVDEDGKRYVTDSFTDSNGTFVINVNALKSVPAALGHELIHNLKGTSVYNDIVAHVSARLQAEGKDINVLAKEVEKTWGDTETVKGTRDAVEEIVCDFFGNRILNNIDSLVDFGKVSKPAWIKMRNGAARMISKLTSTSYKSVVQAANEIKNNLAQADNNINSYYSESLKAEQKAKAEKKGIKTVTVEETKSKVKETKVSAEDSKEAIKKQAQKIAKDLIEIGDEYGLGTDDYNDAVDELLDGVDEDVKDMALNLQGAMVEGSTEVEAVKDGDIDISKVATDVIDEDGKIVAQATGDNEVRLSVSTYEADGREVLSKFLETQVKKGDLTKEESEQISGTLENIYEVCKAYVDKYDSFGAWSQAAVVKDSNGKAILSVVKANGDYKMNLDFSLVCAKRRTLDIVLNEMCKNGMIAALSEDKDIGAAQLAKINDIIKNKDGKYGDYDGFDIACDLCFVDTKRYRQYSVAGQFTKIWNGFVKKVAGANKGKLNHFNFSEYDGNVEYADGADTMDGLNWAYLDEYMRTHATNKDGDDITGKVEYKVAKYLSEHHDQLKLLRNGDFMSTVGFTNVLRDAPEILKLYNSKKGSGGPKASFDNVQYLNEISQQSGFSADKAYVVGGVRVQSFSDYMPRMVFDYMQMMAEMAGKNLPAHSYTKVPLYVKQFGLTGMKINMSLTPKVIKGGVAAGLDENGNYAWADESFPYEEALLIQADKAYGKNCGTIAVGVSDAMIRKMMSDPNIRMIIPYHKSGINPIVAHMKFIDGFSEYTNSQNTRYWAVDKNGKGSWKKLDKSMEDFNFNERLHELTKQGRTGTDVVDQVVDEYLDFCHEHHYLPKFSEFLTAKGDNAYERTDGYYKMLEDFTLIDGDGVYQPQGAVQMMFPGEDSAFGSLQSLIEEGLEADNILEQRRAPGSESIESILGVIKNEMLGDNWQAKGYTSKKKSNSKAKLSVSAEENDHYMDLAETYLAQPTELNKYRLDDFVEELARKAGYNRTVWHETKSDPFEEFDITRGDNGGTDSQTPYGVFTKSTDRNIGLGDRQMKLFAKAQNPLVVYNRDEIAQAIPDAAPFFERIADIDKRYGQMYDEAGELEMQFLDEWTEANPDADLDALMPLDKIANNEAFDIPDDNYQNAHNELVRIGNEWTNNYNQVAVQAKEAITKYLKDHGYDSMYLAIDGGSHGRTTDALILLDESQVKSADSITYDENGDIIPATERFNENTKKLKYSISQNASSDIDKILKGESFNDLVQLTDSTPSILLDQSGVKNLPLAMIPSHVRQNILTEQEAINNQLPIDDEHNYHGLGKQLFLDVIESLDNVTLAYRGTKNAENSKRRENYFLLITQLNDNDGNKIIVPVEISRGGQFNQVYTPNNRVKTVFGKTDYRNYIDEQIRKGNLVRIKKRSVKVSDPLPPISRRYNSNASIDNNDTTNSPISQEATKKSKLSVSAAENEEYMNLAERYLSAPTQENKAMLQDMIDKARDKAIGQFHSLQDDADENGWKYHRGKAPTNIRRMYAVFNVSEDGFRAAYAGNKNATPVGVWLDAQNLKSYISDIITMDDGSPAEYIPGDTGKNWKQAFSPELMATYEADGLKRSAGLLLKRGGKHGVMGIANFSQMNLKQDENGNKVSSAKDGALPHNKLVFEIECGMDDDGDLTQYVAEHGRMSGGKNQGLAEIHPNQFYSYKTNPNAKGEWGIAGTFRIARLVPYSEIVSSTEEYNEANGLDIPVQKWVGGYHPEDFGLSVENVDQMYQDGLDSKLMDPITFDDDGNIIPLTERFNPRKRDPRFSTSIDDRELSIDSDTGDLTVSISSSADVLDSEPVDPRAMSIDEAMKTYELYRNERKVYDRARAANRLTEDEMRIVGRLLRGESDLESFVNNPRYNNIKAVYEASQKYNELGKKLEKYRKGIKANYFKEADSYLDGNMDKFKDKKYGLLYDSEIADRNIRDVVQDKSLAKAILDTYFTPVQQANAKKIKDLTAYRNRVKALNLSRDVAKGNVLSESAAVQMVGELEDKLVSLDAKRNRGTKENRAIAQEEYFKVEKQLNDLWESNPKLDKDKIERACVEFRKIYDELIDRMNRTRVANGYEPVPYRQGYFPHFLDEEPDTLLGKMAYKLGIRLNQDALPTTINGITDQFRPGIRWFGNALERKGNNTTFDAVQGFDRYIEGALDMIHHTENIQRVRALATRIRYNASDEGIKRQMERILGDTSLSDEEQHTRIQELYATAPTKLSNFVVWLDEYANLLANKKSSYDRLFERAVGRSVAYNFMKWANSRVAANMIGGNLSSAFTNFIPLAQANSVIGPRWVIQAAYQTLRNTGDKDGFIDTSDFLVNRYGSDRLVDDTGKFAQALGVPMELIDGFASQTVVRAAYLKNKASGMSDEMAMADADRLAYLMMANRSKGEMPNIMSAKNPIVKAFTAFQLEVNNEYRFLLKDLPERKKEEGKSAIVALMMYFLNAYIFNDIYETIVGRRSALDPLDWVNQFAGDVTGYRMPNFLNEVLTDGLSADDFKVGRKGFTDTVSDMLNTVGEDLPFSSAIGLIDSNFSGGRIPLSSAIPNLGDISKAIEGGNASKIGYELYDELSKPLSYFALPTGGNQLQKTGKAALEYMMGEGFNYDNEGIKIIRYPVEQNVPNAIKGAMFGRSAFPTFQDWLDNGSLSKKQSEIYNELDGVVADSNVDIYNALKTIKTSGNKDDKLSSLYDSGLTANAQEMIYRDIMSESQVNALDEALAGGMAFSEFLNGNVIKGPYADQINDAVSSLGTKASADAKAQAVINLDIPYEDKMDALRSIMTDSSYTKMMAGATYGVEPGDYIGAKLLKGQYDIDGNGNYNQAETTALINAEYGKKSNKVKAVLWQMLSGATAAKNNPYDIAAGQRYLDSMN